MKAALVLFGLLAISFAFVHKAHPCNFAENCGIHDMKRVGRADLDKMHTIKIHLRQNNFGDACDSLLQEVSDPSSPKYGQYYSFEQIHELTWDREAIQAVTLFLRSHQIPVSHTDVAPNGEFIKVKAPISTLESMFKSEFHVFKSESLGNTIVRAESYTVPSHVAPYITLVNGIRNFPMYNKNAQIVGLINGPIADGTVTPALIWKLYNMPNETDATPLADQAVFEALGQSYSPDDLKQFQDMYNIPEQDIKKVIGPNDPSQCASNPNNCGEANLDVQYIIAMAQGAPTIYWSIADENGDIFLDFIEEVAKASDPPQVFSISYGGPEHLQDFGDMVRFNTETCKMGLRGLTLFASSGDDGVAGYEARGNPSACAFNPQYPANCPYVTIVGATMGPESGTPEVVCESDKGSLITSGGGFSNLFPQPTWQTKAVTNYLNTAPNLPPKSAFNVTGRAYPDIAALGNAYHVIIGGSNYEVSGTSASSPVFCAMVTLVNGDREVQGKSSLGFLNPLLYTLPSSIFNDITKGNNKCTAGQGSPVCCPQGFYASKGWDPITGFGSIDFNAFANFLTGHK